MNCMSMFSYCLFENIEIKTDKLEQNSLIIFDRSKSIGKHCFALEFIKYLSSFIKKSEKVMLNGFRSCFLKFVK